MRSSRLPTTSSRRSSASNKHPRKGIQHHERQHNLNPRRGPRRSPDEVQVGDHRPDRRHCPHLQRPRRNFGTAPDRPVLGHRQREPDGTVMTSTEQRQAHTLEELAEVRRQRRWPAPGCAPRRSSTPPPRTARQRCSAATSSRLPPNSATSCATSTWPGLPRPPRSIKAGLLR